MTEVTVAQDNDVVVVQEDDAASIVVILDDETEIIQTLEQGPPGPAGPPGPRGPNGDTGPMGPAGPKGDTGPKGSTGAPGPQGPKGDTGSQGPQGNTGAQGPQGDIGPAGPQGVKGDKGDTGDIGPAGPAGTATAICSDTPPAGAADTSLWWESDTGLLYVLYNDGTSKQWVIASPQPDMSTFLLKGGDTMTGPLILSGDPVNINGAASKHYVDASIAAGGSYVDAPTDGSSYGRLNGSWNKVLPVTGGTLTGNLAAADIFAVRTATTGAYYFGGGSSGNVLYNDGGGFHLIGGPFSSSGSISATGSVSGSSINGPGGLWFAYPQWGFSWNSANGDTVLLRAGAAWTSWRAGDAVMIHYGDAYKPGGGVWADASDARIKTVRGDYQSGLDAITALRPVRYTFLGNDTSEPPTGRPIGAAETLEASLKPQPTPETPTPLSELPAEPAAVPYWNSSHRRSAEQGTEYIGLVAQECEGPMPELVTRACGYIGGEEVQDLRNLDTGPLIFALINACKELKAMNETLAQRVAALESGALGHA